MKKKKYSIGSDNANFEAFVQEYIHIIIREEKWKKRFSKEYTPVFGKTSVSSCMMGPPPLVVGESNTSPLG